MTPDDTYHYCVLYSKEQAELKMRCDAAGMVPDEMWDKCSQVPKTCGCVHTASLFWVSDAASHTAAISWSSNSAQITPSQPPPPATAGAWVLTSATPAESAWSMMKPAVTARQLVAPKDLAGDCFGSVLNEISDLNPPSPTTIATITLGIRSHQTGVLVPRVKAREEKILSQVAVPTSFAEGSIANTIESVRMEIPTPTSAPLSASDLVSGTISVNPTATSHPAAHNVFNQINDLFNQMNVATTTQHSRRDVLTIPTSAPPSYFAPASISASPASQHLNNGCNIQQMALVHFTVIIMLTMAFYFVVFCRCMLRAVVRRRKSKEVVAATPEGLWGCEKCPHCRNQLRSM